MKNRAEVEKEKTHQPHPLPQVEEGTTHPAKDWTFQPACKFYCFSATDGHAFIIEVEK